MNTQDYLIIVVGGFVLYLGIVLIKKNKTASILSIIIGLIIAVFPFASHLINTEAHSNDVVVEGDNKSAVEKASTEDNGEFEVSDPIDVAPKKPIAGFEGDIKVAQFNANRWYLKATRLWQGGSYMMPDSVVIYINEALYYYEFAEAYNVRGQAKVQMGKMKDAINDYSRAIELNPDLGQPYFNRGTAYYIMSNLPPACKDWKKAEELGVQNASLAMGQYCR